jgi:hypothetical protein
MRERGSGFHGLPVATYINAEQPKRLCLKMWFAANYQGKHLALLCHEPRDHDRGPTPTKHQAANGVVLEPNKIAI